MTSEELAKAIDRIVECTALYDFLPGDNEVLKAAAHRLRAMDEPIDVDVVAKRMANYFGYPDPENDWVLFSEHAKAAIIALNRKVKV